MKIKCPACSQVLNVPDTAAGKVVKCPCGKQLRAPAAKAGGAAAAASATGGPAAASQPMGGVDTGMFDELTDGDMKPIRAVGSSGHSAAAGPSGGNTARLLQDHAATAGGSSGPTFRRGPVASRWVRLGAAVLDGFIIGIMAGPIIVACMFLLVPMMVDVDAVKNAENLTPEQQQALTAQVGVSIMLAYGVSVAIAYLPPIMLYAIMVTKSGQTPAKKICGIRILLTDGELPGFVRGVFLRSWVFNLVYAIPFVALVDYCMIFGEERRCLHDIVASTIVVES